MAFKPVTVTKNGVDRVAHSPAELVAHRWNGFLPKTAKDAKAAEANVAPFDPSEHTASQVAEYLATASDTEAQRVRDAEVAGKNRASALA